MLKEIKIPLTIENVGSEGKFMTDNMLLKFVGIVVLDAIISLLVLTKLDDWVRPIVSIPISIIFFFIMLYFFVTKLVFNGKATIRALDKASKFKTVNTRHFNDIFEYNGNVAIHNSGHCSIFVELVRGSTLGVSEDKIENYYRTIQEFENHILQMGYTYKSYNIETDDITAEKTLMRRQIYNARNINPKLEANLKLRYKYNQVYMEECVRGDRIIYVIIDVTNDLKQFEARISQVVRSISNPMIAEQKILTPEEVDALSSEYFDTLTTDSNVIVDCDDLPVIITNEEV